MTFWLCDVSLTRIQLIFLPSQNIRDLCNGEKIIIIQIARRAWPVAIVQDVELPFLL